MPYVAQNRDHLLCLTGWVSAERAAELVEESDGAITIEASDRAAAYRTARAELRPEWR
jgi:hypothetical protein